jgi:competence protein ComEA
MLKKFLLVIAGCIASIGFAFAQVDVNKADQAALDGIKGIGPKMSQRVLDERKKGGDFKDWNDLQSRVKGIKEKSATRLSNAGLTVNGQSKNGVAPTEMAPKSSAKNAPSKMNRTSADKPAAIVNAPATEAGKKAAK